VDVNGVSKRAEDALQPRALFAEGRVGALLKPRWGALALRSHPVQRFASES
jgi:hypothetical protein